MKKKYSSKTKTAASSLANLDPEELAALGARALYRVLTVPGLLEKVKQVTPRSTRGKTWKEIRKHEVHGENNPGPEE